VADAVLANKASGLSGLCRARKILFFPCDDLERVGRRKDFASSHGAHIEEFSSSAVGITGMAVGRASSFPLCEFYCRDRPHALVTSDGNLQSMEFIKPDLVYSPGLSVGQNDGFANKLGLSPIEFGEDCARSLVGEWHDVARMGCK